MLRPPLLGFLTLLLAFATGAVPARAAAMDQSLAIGNPNGGKLVGGQRFHETRHMKALPARASSAAKWALPSLLALLDRASRAVAHRYPGSVMLVGELSNRDGGPIASHRSHQNGRDVDIAFYLVNDSGETFRQPYYIHCNRRGGALADQPLRFDLRRNWAFVRALVEDKQASVMQIFVYAPLRARLLSFAERTGVPQAIRVRAASAMAQPMNAEPHDDHFHIRIACPLDQIELGCVDYARSKATDPYWLLGDEVVAAPAPRAIAGALRGEDGPNTGRVTDAEHLLEARDQVLGRPEVIERATQGNDATRASSGHGGVAAPKQAVSQ